MRGDPMNIQTKHFLFTFCLIGLLGLNACSAVGIATGAAATTGIAAAQEGGISRAISDTKIKAMINDAWLKYDLDTFAKLSTTVKNGRVLITGVVQQPEHRVEAVRLAWQVEGVKSVINEIRVADSEGIVGFAKDTWISTRLRTEITFDSDIQSINYSIETVQGVVYLMGYAQNQLELNDVIEHARTISGVKQVVSYVKLVGIDEDEMRAQQAAPAQQSGQAESYQETTSDSSLQTSPNASTPAAVQSEPIPLNN